MKKSDCTDEQWIKYKARMKAWREANIERERTRQRDNYHKPERKAKATEYRQRPEVKARKQELERERYYARKTATGKAITPEEHAARLDRQRKTRTGMTAVVRARMFVHQNGCCAVCQRPFDEKQIRADHCHDSGDPRGLLCHHCNIIEGMIRSMAISPIEFGNRLAHYLLNPPFKDLGR